MQATVQLPFAYHSTKRRIDTLTSNELLQYREITVGNTANGHKCTKTDAYLRRTRLQCTCLRRCNFKMVQFWTLVLARSIASPMTLERIVRTTVAALTLPFLPRFFLGFPIYKSADIALLSASVCSFLSSGSLAARTFGSALRCFSAALSCFPFYFTGC